MSVVTVLNPNQMSNYLTSFHTYGIGTVYKGLFDIDPSSVFMTIFTLNYYYCKLVYGFIIFGELLVNYLLIGIQLFRSYHLRSSLKDLARLFSLRNLTNCFEID